MLRPGSIGRLLTFTCFYMLAVLLLLLFLLLSTCVSDSISLREASCSTFASRVLYSPISGGLAIGLKYSLPCARGLLAPEPGWSRQASPLQSAPPWLLFRAAARSAL